MHIYFDSSAIAKRYVEEKGSDAVANLCSNAAQISLSIISSLEVLSGLTRLKSAGKLASKYYRSLKRELSLDLRDAFVVLLETEVIRLAVRCLERCPQRSLDAIHIASALTCGCDLFVTADARQVKGAKIMGLEVKFIE